MALLICGPGGCLVPQYGCIRPCGIIAGKGLRYYGRLAYLPSKDIGNGRQTDRGNHGSLKTPVHLTLNVTVWVS